jgi:type II secretory pathway pseudopilin PulG
MAALLVALSIMAIMMTVVMPVWKQTVRREKEEELVFRGKQYVHAIGLYQRKVANTFPANIDLLVEQRFLRKKFKDPITNDDFVPIPVGGAIPGQAAPTGQRGATGATGSTGPGSTGPGASTGGTAGGASGGRAGGPPASTVTSPGQSAAGIMGVTSKSKEQSIRLYNGKGHYNEWAFLYVQQQQTPGAGAPGSATPGGRGQQPGQQPPGGVNPGGRGRGGPGGRGGAPGSGGRGGNGGLGIFGNGGVTPIQPPTPTGRL